MDASDLPKSGFKVSGHKRNSSISDDCLGYSVSENKVSPHKACKVRRCCAKYSLGLYPLAQAVDGYDDVPISLRWAWKLAQVIHIKNLKWTIRWCDMQRWCSFYCSIHFPILESRTRCHVNFDITSPGCSHEYLWQLGQCFSPSKMSGCWRLKHICMTASHKVDGTKGSQFVVGDDRWCLTPPRSS